MIIKPMLAATIKDVSKLTFPLLASPKLDGIRVLILDKQAYTYSRLNEKFKVLRNRFMRSLLKTLPNGLDGELMTFKEDGSYDTFNDAQSKIMSGDGEHKFEYCIFDCLPNQQCHVPFSTRIDLLNNLDIPFFCNLLTQTKIESLEQLETYEEETIRAGYEGVMLRLTGAPYKQGRSTLNEKYLMKLKRFVDAEAEVVGFEELVRENSSEKTNLMGALICKYNDTMFNIGTGFTDEQRKMIWLSRSQLEGKQVTFKFQSHGVKTAPRSPVFKSFRLE
jgi:DNA ligase-1